MGSPRYKQLVHVADQSRRGWQEATHANQKPGPRRGNPRGNTKHRDLAAARLIGKPSNGGGEKGFKFEKKKKKEKDTLGPNASKEKGKGIQRGGRGTGRPAADSKRGQVTNHPSTGDERGAGNKPEKTGVKGPRGEGRMSVPSSPPLFDQAAAERVRSGGRQGTEGKTPPRTQRFAPRDI